MSHNEIYKIVNKWIISSGVLEGGENEKHTLWSDDNEEFYVLSEFYVCPLLTDSEHFEHSAVNGIETGSNEIERW